jgi:FixJ family two-component response regulator
MSSDTPIVFIVDDDASVREALEELVRRAGWQPETFASARVFLTRAPVRGPSCAVLDVALSDISGLDLQARLAADRTSMPIIFVTACGDVRISVEAMKAGAVEFLSKPIADEALLSAIGKALELSKRKLRRDADAQSLRDRYALLSDREREVMAMVVTGSMNKQIGSELGIAEITVKAHRGRVMKKMEANSLAGLVNMAITLNGLPQYPERRERQRPPAEGEAIDLGSGRCKEVGRPWWPRRSKDGSRRDLCRWRAA